MLSRSKDRKVTNAVTPNGAPAIANSFGLPSGQEFSCPGATDFCSQVCYAGKLENMYPSARRLLVRNFQTLLYADYIGGIDAMADELFSMVNDFVVETMVRIEKGKSATYDFRIHWDGDFFSRDYAIAWRQVIELFPDVTFWVYTRSFDVVDIFEGVENLSLYLSADVDNKEDAIFTRDLFPFANIAYVDNTFADGRAVLPDAYKCPENGKRIPLISEKGSACVRCGICVKGRGDVLFSVKKR